MSTCRACFSPIFHAEFYSLNKSYPNSECELLKDRLKVCIPEMDLDLVIDPVLCGLCYNTFNLFYNLRQKCLETEEKLQNLVRTRNCTAEQIITNVEGSTKSGDSTIKIEYDENTEIIVESADDNSIASKVIKEDTIVDNCSLPSTSSAEFMETKYIRRSIKKEFKCECCDYSTCCCSNFQQHIQRHCNSKPYMTVHTGIKPFKCKECKYEFRFKNELVAHARKHIKTKPYKCNICYKTYKRKSSLICHKETHRNAKLSKCSKCEFTTWNEDDLFNHLKMHTQQKVYACHICNQLYKYKISLVRHVKYHMTHHGKNADEA